MAFFSFFWCVFPSSLKPSFSNLGKAWGASRAGVLSGEVRCVGTWEPGCWGLSRISVWEENMCIFHHLAHACCWSFSLPGIYLVWAHVVDLRREGVIPGRFFLSNWGLEWVWGCLVKPASSSPTALSVSMLEWPQHKMSYSYKIETLSNQLQKSC